MTTKPDPASLIDTSKMSEGERAALEMAEESRDWRAISGFAGALFTGAPDFRRLCPFPEQPAEDRNEGDRFLEKLGAFLRDRCDPDEIDRSGEIPDEVIAGLAGLGAFGIKIPREFGGLGLSQTNYSRAAMLLGWHCGNITALLSAHQSIGVPQPLIVFGTNEQKRKYLPLCAAGGISAFALTERDVGSDPARMQTEAVREGDYWVLNGEKIWCTNGLKARSIIVMARTPQPDKPNATTAFIVETGWPGVEIVVRCHFMGLRALYNCVMHFRNVRVPHANVVHQEGKGLKVALTTLNTGRLTLPAACVGAMKRCLEIAAGWSAERIQWGQAIGKHAAIASKLADMAADAFATEAMVRYVSALVDADKSADIRIEAAMAKLWGTEAAWRVISDTMQVRGGRGYETAGSLARRGESPDPVERMLRDSRINTIFEGSSEIMRLFIAREAMDPHLRRGARALDSRLPLMERARAGLKAAAFYAWWYPSRYLPLPARVPSGMDPALVRDMRGIARKSRRLSRAVFHAMVRYGPKLDRRQLLLGRLVDLGTELFAMSCACSRAASEPAGADDPSSRQAIEIARFLCARGRRRIDALFRDVRKAPDGQGYRLAQRLLKTEKC
ncbi:MAG TPA: acyl-CoA dehydrogenase family protein [Verrucomicrobiales bacterium]|nr:acyl-CoA dehydrogenase family protein [Verrucomicrobiales bacterium]